MTYLEFRQKLAELAVKHKAERDAILEEQLFMTYLELRQKLAELAVKHKAERNAILAQYNAQDRTAAKAARAKVARDARAAATADRRVEKGALQFIHLWNSYQQLFRYPSPQGLYCEVNASGPLECSQLMRAGEMQAGYTVTALTGTLFRVTRIVTT